MLSTRIPVPDRETAGFFDAARKGRLVFCACESCERPIHPPMPHCPHCGSWKTKWQGATGHGRLYSWTTVHRQIHPEFPTPYTVVVVELDDAPEVRLLGWLAGVPELANGMPMTVWFDTVEQGGTALPQWRL